MGLTSPIDVFWPFHVQLKQYVVIDASSFSLQLLLEMLLLIVTTRAAPSVVC